MTLRTQTGHAARFDVARYDAGLVDQPRLLASLIQMIGAPAQNTKGGVALLVDGNGPRAATGGGDDHLIFRVGDHPDGAPHWLDGGLNSAIRPPVGRASRRETSDPLRDTAWLTMSYGEYEAYGAEIRAVQNALKAFNTNLLKAVELARARGQIVPVAQQNNDATYRLESLGLTLTGLENLQVLRENVAPVARGEFLQTTESASVRTVDVRLNDHDADRLDRLRIAAYDETSERGARIVAAAEGVFIYQPGGAFESLAEGDVMADSFGYEIADLAGERASARVAVQVRGENDAPTVAGPLSAVVTANGVPFQMDLLTGAIDVDHGATLVVSDVRELSGVSAARLEGNVLTVATDQFASLGQGATQTLHYQYRVVDEHGAGVDQTAVVTVVGINDAPTVAAPLSFTLTESSGFVPFDLLAGAHDVDLGDALRVGGLTETGGQGHWSLAGNFVRIDSDAFDALAAGQTVGWTFNYVVADTFNAAVAQTARVVLHGVNDRPTVAGPLSGHGGEYDGEMEFNLLAGAADVDAGAILSVAAFAEAHGQAGWRLDGNRVFVQPSAFRALEPGQSAVLDFNFQVVDQWGAGINQNLRVTIDGAPAAPRLTVAVAAGATAVNEVLFDVTCDPLEADRVNLSFTGLPVGATLFDQAGLVVNGGMPNFDGTERLRLVLPENVDATGVLSVVAAGFLAGGEALGSATRAVPFAYDQNLSADALAFSARNQSMWGEAPTIISWHDYIPLLGGTPVRWDADAEEWVEQDASYWRSGDITLIDFHVDSDDIVDDVLAAVNVVLDGARAVFNSTASAVDAVAQAAYDLALGTFRAAEQVYYYGARAVDAGVRATFEAAKAVYDGAVGVYNVASYAFNVVADGLHDAAWARWSSYSNWYNSLDGWGQFWNAVPYGVEAGLWGAAELAYQTAQGIWWLADQVFNAAGTGAKAVYQAALATYEAAAGAVDALARETFAAAEDAFADAAALYNDAKQAVYDAAQAVYDGVRETVYAAVSNNPFDFETRIKADAEVFAQVGVQVDFELDLGSVDADLDYALTTRTQYNQSTDLLIITPTMVSETTGTEVAFDTISPNLKLSVSMLYDLGVDLALLLDGKLKVGALTVYDLTPNSDQPIAINTTVSTNAPVPVPPGMPLPIPLPDGKLPILNFDSTALEPFEVPVDALLGLFGADDILSITLAFPTVETEGVAATYDRDQYFKEGGAVSVDLSELTDIFLNMVNTRIDFSPELRALTNLPSLADGLALDQVIEGAVQAFTTVLWDLLDGQVEAVPIFLIDHQDSNSTSLLHVNAVPDDFSTLNANTGKFGFYTAYGESDPVLDVSVDIDQFVAFVVNKIVEAVATAVSAGAAAPATQAIPTINPLNLSFGLEDVLEMIGLGGAGDGGSGGGDGGGGGAGGGDAGGVGITDIIDLSFGFEAADLDVNASADFSQEFTLSIDDFAFRVTLEDGAAYDFAANAAGRLSIPQAGSHDANHDGTVDYTMEIVPTAMFSNDTEVGLGLGYVFDLLKAEFSAGIKLPLADLLGVAGLPEINIPGIDIGLGPLLRVQGDLDVLDVDVFEDRFDFDLGLAEVAGSVDVSLIGVPEQAPA